MGSRMLCWLAPAAFLLDRITKQWVRGRDMFRWPVEVWPGVLRFTYVQNTGAAFGLLRDKTTLLTLVTGVILLSLLVWLLIRGKALAKAPKAALWLLLGGASGNLLDRVLYGYVIDFIEIRLFAFPVFNVADICVCLAFAIFLGWICFGREWRENGREQA